MGQIGYNYPAPHRILEIRSNNMKKQEEQNQIVSVDEFDETVSLFQLIPAGSGKGISHLKVIVDSIINSPGKQPRKPLSILLTGKQGLRTHGRSFIRALGIESINESPAQLLNSSMNAMHEFFNPSLLPDSYVISNINMLCPFIKLHQLNS